MKMIILTCSIYVYIDLQAQPLLKDRRFFELIADPLLEGNYPTKGLHQALAVAAMCLQEEASTRPLISDVVIALAHLSGKGIKDENAEDNMASDTVDRNIEDGGTANRGHDDGGLETEDIPEAR